MKQRVSKMPPAKYEGSRSVETPDYLTYKKLKRQYSFDSTKPRKTPNPKFFIRFFVLTFVVCFILILNLTNKYTSKIDIEYGSSLHGNKAEQSDNAILGEIKSGVDEEKYSIDRRLTALYNEEIGLSTARAIKREDANPIDSAQYEKIKNEQTKILEEPAKADDKSEKLIERTFPLSPIQEQQLSPVKLTYTKILIGKYRNLEDAKKVQEQIRKTPEFSALTPFVRKVGDIYTIQVGSYTNVEIAKNIADKFQRANYNVWIAQ